MRRGHGHLREAFGAAAELLLRAHADVVLVVAGVEGGGDLAGDQRVQRLLDIEHARRRGRRRAARSISRRTSGLPLRSVVSASATPGIVFIFASSASEYLASFCRSGPWMKYWMSALLWLPPTVLTSSTPVWISGGNVLQQVARALHELLLR